LEAAGGGFGLEEVFVAAEFGIGELEFDALPFEVNSLGLGLFALGAGDLAGPSNCIQIHSSVFAYFGEGTKCSIGSIGCIGYFCALGA
jgi:hypothetical protein